MIFKKIIFRKIILTLTIFFVGQVQCAQDQQKLFVRGNELFEQAHYQDAFNVYERIIDKGFIVFYNMGLCCLRQGKKAETILCMKRAEKQASTYKEFTLVENVLHFDENKEVIGMSWYQQITVFLKKCILIIPILLMQLIVLWSLIFLIVLWYCRWYKKYPKKSVLFLILWCMFYYIVSYKINFMQQKYGVVMEASIPVYAGPDESFYKKSDLNQSDLVAIIDQHNEYYKITLDKNIGWIDRKAIELV